MEKHVIRCEGVLMKKFLCKSVENRRSALEGVSWSFLQLVDFDFGFDCHQEWCRTKGWFKLKRSQ